MLVSLNSLPQSYMLLASGYRDPELLQLSIDLQPWPPLMCHTPDDAQDIAHKTVDEFSN